MGSDLDSDPVILKGFRRMADRLLSERRAALSAVEQESDELAKAVKHVEDVTQAQHLVQTVAQGVQRQAHDRIAGVVTRCLQTVFEDPYEFRIEFLRKRGRTEARLVFTRGGQEYDPKGECGGGVLDVAAFALRLSCLVLRRPRLRRLLVLDEPFRFVSRDHSERIGEMLLALSKDLQVQFVLVTHDEGLRCGKVVELS